MVRNSQDENDSVGNIVDNKFYVEEYVYIFQRALKKLCHL